MDQWEVAFEKDTVLHPHDKVPLLTESSSKYHLFWVVLVFRPSSQLPISSRLTSHSSWCIFTSTLKLSKWKKQIQSFPVSPRRAIRNTRQAQPQQRSTKRGSPTLANSQAFEYLVIYLLLPETQTPNRLNSGCWGYPAWLRPAPSPRISTDLHVPRHREQMGFSPKSGSEKLRAVRGLRDKSSTYRETPQNPGVFLLGWEQTGTMIVNSIIVWNILK